MTNHATSHKTDAGHVSGLLRGEFGTPGGIAGIGVTAGDSGLNRAEGSILVLNTNLASPWARKHDSRDAKREREKLKWSRLAAARELLLLNGENESDSKLAKHRTKKCMWCNVAYSVEHWRLGQEHAFFKAVAICGSRSACPVCGEKIWAWDRDEIQRAMTEISKRGLYTCMVTYTLRHDQNMLCGESLDKLNQATRRVKSGKAWQTIKKTYGLQGSITVLENTWSRKNGHHPHKHDVEIMNRFLTDDELAGLQERLTEMYLAALEKLGASGAWGVAVNVRRGSDYVAEYVAKVGHEPKAKKWGAARELSSYAFKTKGNEHGHYSMMQLLDLYADDDGEAGEAWRDYVSAFAGRWMVRWSQGLRQALNIEAETDDLTKASADEKESRVFALYPIEAWRKARRRQGDVIVASLWVEFDEFKARMLDMGIEVESPVFELVDNGFDVKSGK